MKSYVKPTLEVISMRTSENIADNNIIKTIYTKAAGDISGTYEYIGTGSSYNDSLDRIGSQNL